MAVLDYAAKEVRFRFAIGGAAGAGKAALLSQLHAALPPMRRDDLFIRAIGRDQLAGFDFSPPCLVPLAGHVARAAIRTLAGPVCDPAAWRHVFEDVDAVVFVADSRRGRQEENRAALRQLGAMQHLAEVPLVFFHSHAGDSGALAAGDAAAQINPAGAPATSDPATVLALLMRAAIEAA